MRPESSGLEPAMSWADAGGLDPFIEPPIQPFDEDDVYIEDEIAEDDAWSHDSGELELLDLLEIDQKSETASSFPFGSIGREFSVAQRRDHSDHG